MKNTGKVDGEEVVQIYVSPTEKTVFRSDIELKGFAKVSLKAGESKLVTVHLDKRAFAYYNTNEKDFVCDDGKYVIKAGASVKDTRLEADVTLSGFGIHENPYSEEITAFYKDADVTKLNRADFEKVLGRKLEVKKPEKPFTWNNCLGDAKGTKWGDIIESLINVVSTNLKMNIGNSEMIYSGAMETPIRTLVAMANGVVTEGLGDALVDLMNEKPGALLKVLGNGVLTGVNALKNMNRE